MTRAAEIATTRRLIAEANARISRLIAMPAGTKKRRLLTVEEGNLRDLTKDLARLEGRTVSREAVKEPDAPAPVTRSAPAGAEKWRPSKCDVTKLPPRQGGWEELTFSRHDVMAFEARDRDAIEAARRRIARSQSEDLFCPVVEIEHELSPGTLAIYAYANIDGKRTHVGTLAAHADTVDGERVFVTKSADIEEYGVLADCPGVGRRMYERAAEVACGLGGRIVGSRLRSAFSEKFWKRQVTKGRATCRGSTAEVFMHPLHRLREALEDGRITVPQFAQLTCGIPSRPTTERWGCEYVPLNKEICPEPPDPKAKIDLSGLRGRGRYRLTTSRRRR